MSYATLHECKQFLGIDTTNTNDDALLTALAGQATKIIEGYCGRRFDVRSEDLLHDYPYEQGSSLPKKFVSGTGSVRASGKLRFVDDLLMLNTLTNGDGDTIAASDYALYPTGSQRGYPKRWLELKYSSGVVWQVDSSGDWEQVISVDGLWGYHDRYTTDAWVDSSDTVQDNPLSASATSLTVSDADGANARSVSPRFQVGQLLRFGTSSTAEFAEVLAVNTSTEVLTIARGYNGTTAASQAQSTAIYVYQPMESIRLAAQMLVKHLYRVKDVDELNVQEIVGTGVKITPDSMPLYVRKLLPAPKVSL